LVEPVKRNYSSPLREAQARETRRAIVRAGSELFVRQGFGLTTVDEIAEAAGVSRKTVFTSVGGKGEVLKLAVDWAITGDDEPIPLAERPIIKRAEASTDPDELIRIFASLVTGIGSRNGALMWVATTAAGADDDARRLVETYSQQRMYGARGFTGGLAATGGMRADLSMDDAIDIAWVHNDPLLYHRLVNQRGWSKKKFEAWLQRTLTVQFRGDI
jgi:AcrR family transcriptional regulator